LLKLIAELRCWYVYFGWLLEYLIKKPSVPAKRETF